MKAVRPRIGLTARYHPETRSYRVADDYVAAILRAGGQPYLLPYADDSVADEILSSIDGLVLTGGEDIDPSFYGGRIRLDDYPYYPARDRFEISLARSAIAMGTATLGICRGCQILHVATDGDLIPDVPQNLGVLHRRSRTEVSVHSVSLVPGSRVALAYGMPSVKITSYHHQGLIIDDAACAPWQVTAASEDGLAEAIELNGQAWIVGVLWHPELPTSKDSFDGDRLFRSFVSAAGGLHV